MCVLLWDVGQVIPGCVCVCMCVCGEGSVELGDSNEKKSFPSGTSVTTM